MQRNQIRKNTAGVVIHNNINNHPILNIPMIINGKDIMIYEVLNTAFHTNDTVAIITTNGFVTPRVNTSI